MESEQLPGAARVVVDPRPHGSVAAGARGSALADGRVSRTTWVGQVGFNYQKENVEWQAIGSQTEGKSREEPPRGPVSLAAGRASGQAWPLERHAGSGPNRGGGQVAGQCKPWGGPGLCSKSNGKPRTALVLFVIIIISSIYILLCWALNPGLLPC